LDEQWFGDLLDRDKAAERAHKLLAEIDDREAELVELRDLYEFFRRRAGLVPKGTTRANSTAAAVIQVLDEAQRPMRSRDVLVALGASAKRETVNWALWDAERRGLIKKVAPGEFAALSYEPPVRRKRKAMPTKRTAG
jgi:hypothetical protein